MSKLNKTDILLTTRICNCCGKPFNSNDPLLDVCYTCLEELSDFITDQVMDKDKLEDY